MTSTDSEITCEIRSDDVWQAVRQLGVFRRSNTELDALIAAHSDDPLFVDRMTIEAARLVRNLRREAAAGIFV